MEQIPVDLINTIRAISGGGGTTSTEIIQAAEKRFNEYKAEPNQLVTCLLFLLLKSEEALIKEGSSVLLRQLVSPDSKKSLYEQLQPATRDLVKDQAFQYLLSGSQMTTSIRHKLVDIIASLAPPLIKEGKWPDLLPQIIRLCKCDNEIFRESAFLILGQMAPSLEEHISNQTTELAHLLHGGLSDPAILVKIASLKAITQLLSMNGVNASVFEPLIPSMLVTITAAIEMNQERSAQEAIAIFIVICEIKPTWFRNNIPNLLESFFQVLESDTVEEETKHYTLEFFMMIAEKRPSAWKKYPNYLVRLVTLLYKWLSTVEEIDLKSWNATNEDTTGDDTTDADVAQEAFDRLSHALGKVMVPVVSQFLKTLCASPVWGDRYAALTSITMIGEGCNEFLRPHLAGIIDLILPLVKDPVPRVKWAVFFCLGQLATDFQKEMHKYHAILLPQLGFAFSDPNPRVQAMACLFLTTFLEEMDKDIVIPLANELIHALLPLLQSPRFYLAENALTSFSSITEVIGSEFSKFYNDFMPFLVGIIRNNTGKESRVLRGRAMEAISLIGLAVGKEKFATDLDQIMTYMATQPPFANDDPQMEFFLRACTRFCQCLEKDFTRYLDFAMKPLLNAILAKVEITTDDDEFEHSITEEGVMTMDNKALSLELLGFYADVLEGALFPYFEPLVKNSIELLDYDYNEEIRLFAANLLPNLLKVCVSHYGKTEENSVKAFSHILKHLSDSALKEAVPELISGKLKSIGDCIAIIGKQKVPQEDMKVIVVCFKEMLDGLQELKEEAQDEQDEDDDDPDAMGEMEFIIDAYNSACVTLGELLIYNPASTSTVAQILNLVTEFVSRPDEDKSIQASMICLLDDFCESGDSSATDYYPHIIPLFLHHAKSTDVACRHASVYGLGIAAQKAPNHFHPYAMETIKQLNAIISAPNSRNEENTPATDNAISAFGRIINHLSTSLTPHLPDLLKFWIGSLPIQDEVEAAACMDNLVHLASQYPVQTFGNQMSNLERIIYIIDNAISNNYIKDKTKLTGIQQYLLSQMSAIPPQYQQQCQVFASLKF